MNSIRIDFFHKIALTKSLIEMRSALKSMIALSVKAGAAAEK